MLLLRLLIWTLLPGPARLLRHCLLALRDSSSGSPLLQTLQCHNDYDSHVSCQWTEESDRRLPVQLWIQTGNHSHPCPPDGPPVLLPDGRRRLRCRLRATHFSISTTHHVFFIEQQTNCSSPPHRPVASWPRRESHSSPPVVRALPPVDLLTGRTDGGDRWLRWSSPYPESPALCRTMTYQVGFRSDDQDEWKITDVNGSSVKFLKGELRASCSYTARVRGRAEVSQWSVWSPGVTWRTPEDSGQPPCLRCVLTGERTVTCRWSVSRILDQILGFQLACGPLEAAAAESCCPDPAPVPDPAGTRVTYSCSIRALDPAHLKLQLRPFHRSKSFPANQHIRPSSPGQLHISPNGADWRVKWTEPRLAPDLQVSYQVCYFLTGPEVRPRPQDCSALLNVSATSVNIRDATLVPARSYTVQVRSVVKPGSGSRYEGPPSEWAGPVKWTSHPAGWSPRTLVYFCCGLLVASLFLALYFSYPACHRRAVLWVDSVPSPEKSRIMSEFLVKTWVSKAGLGSESGSKLQVMLTEKTRLSSVHPSSCTSPDLPGGTEELDRGYWSGENWPLQVQEPQPPTMGFSGPYIFCEENFPSEGGTYVSLPEQPPPTRAPDHADTLTCSPGDSDAAAAPPTIDPYVSGPPSCWPAPQASGYCSLPAPQVM